MFAQNNRSIFNKYFNYNMYFCQQKYSVSIKDKKIDKKYV